jgi:hypothetical protein
MLGYGILALIGIGLVKVPKATISGLKYIASHGINWIVQFWTYLGGLK